MKIGYFTSIEGWGGSELYIRDLMLAVRQLGHEPVLFGLSGSRLMDEARALGISCVPWKEVEVLDKMDSGGNSQGVKPSDPWVIKSIALSILPRSLKTILGNVQEIFRLIQLFRRNVVDVMHVTVHGYEVAGVAAKVAGIPSVALFPISPVPGQVWWRRMLARLTARGYNRICISSRYSAREWCKELGFSDSRCEVVLNSVDVSRFRALTRTREVGSGPGFKVITVARLHPMKGLKYLIEAMHPFAGTGVTLDIVGDGDEAEELQALVQALALSPIVRFLGHSDKHIELLLDADCFVLPSVSHEGLPLALLDAMAVGLPVITSDYGPLPEVNLHQKTGLVVPARNSRDLSQAICWLVKNPNRAREMGEAGRRHVCAFDRKVMVGKFLEQYRLALGEQARVMSEA